MLTGGGALAGEFQRQTGAVVCSVRKASDEDMMTQISQSSIVIHNAANLHPASFEEALTDNVALTRRVLEACAKSPNKPVFVYISSMSMLQQEAEYRRTDQMTLYALSKYLGELFVLRHSYARVMAVRFSTIFYADQGRDGLSYLCATAAEKKEINLINEGEAKRDFIPLSLAVRAIIERLAEDNFSRKPVNIASGFPYSFREIADLLNDFFPGLRIHNQKADEAAVVLNSFNTDEYIKKHISGKGFLKQYIAEYIRQLK